MSRRLKHLSWLVVTGLVLGIYSAPLLASEPAKTAQRNIPILVAQLRADGDTSLVPVDFKITDVSIDGNRLTLYGKRRDDKGPASVTLTISATPKRADVATSGPHIFSFDDIFNRDDAH